MGDKALRISKKTALTVNYCKCIFLPGQVGVVWPVTISLADSVKPECVASL